MHKRRLLYAAIALFLVSLLTAWYFQIKPSVANEQKAIERYIQKEQENINKLVKDTALMRRLVLKEETMEEYKRVARKNFGFFLFAETLSSTELLFWNNQKILPPPADFNQGQDVYFQKLSNGSYVIMKKKLRLPGMSNNVIAYAMIPVLHQYYLETDYLKTRFVHDKGAINKVFIADQPTEFAIKSLENRHLFYIGRKTFNAMTVTDTLTILLRIAGLIFLLVYIHLTAEVIGKKKGPKYGIIFLGLVLVIVRALLYNVGFFFSFRQFLLFDPSVYATNWLNRSLGDLLINAILGCWIVMFAWYHLGPIKRLPSFLKRKGIYVAGVVAVFVLIFITFQLANVIRSVVADSKISFNVTDFFSLDFYSVVGFIVFALLCLGYYYLSRLLFRFIYPAFQANSVYVYFFIALVGLILLAVRAGNPIVLFHLPVLIWLIIYTWLLSQEQFIINRFKVTVAGVLFWIFIFSISLSTIILQGNQQKEWIVRRGIAEKYDQLSDPSSQNILSIAITYLDNRFVRNNFHRFRDQRENRTIRDSIIKENFSGYINKYQTQIYVFDSLNQGVNNDDRMSYAEVNNIFSVQSKPTGIPDLYYHETSFDKLTYITKRVVRDSTGLVGTFFIISTPKEGNTDAFYPELFRRVNQNDVENSPIYSYAIYTEKLLISSSAKYPFQTTLTEKDIPKQEVEKRINNDYDELWYRASNKKVVVIAKKRDSVLESLTLFSYLFCAFLFMVGIIRIFSLLLKAANERIGLRIFWQLNIRSQIHGTVIFISVLSFLIIGAATISFFIARYQRNNVDKLSRTAGIMVKEMQKRLVAQATFDDVIKIYDSVSNQDLKKLIDEVADIHDVDVNVYNLQGDLNVSSEEDVYTKGILSTKMHPEAFYHLHRLRQVQYVQEETMSSLKYLSIYSAVRDEEGRVYAYLNIPYFSSEIDLQQEISNFLVTIINLNAFIFLIAGVIALFITNKITRSFSVIGDKMKEITLGGTNEEITWNRNDEIGELVKQYNKMVNQLEQSAEALAKSEREGAWREMARQVAHEIKNPLTPMKLSIQYLQKAINNNQGNVKELTASVANTLIEQIDHLSKIAADFSQFANIGIKKVETVDLRAVLTSLVSLYQANPKVEITWEKYEGPVYLRADKTHMNRLFTNLLSNAVEACNEKPRCCITIKEHRKENNILISIRDNGEGIPREMHTRIFTPNFTTKTSGTGLGLAMCKSIVEQSEGSIWFETEPGNGTTFFIQLPLIS
jgi:signal transduction histidine kinase